MQALQVLEHLVEPAAFLYFMSIIPWNGCQCKPTLSELLEKHRLEGIFLPACCYTSMVLASRRWDCVYRMMLSPSLRTRSPLGIRTLPFRRTMTMMV